MTLRWIVQNWLRQVAAQRVKETVVSAAQEQLAQATSGADSLAPCDAGVIFALGEEAGGLEDLLAIEARLAGDGFSVRVGTIRNRRVAIAISGARAAAAAKAAEALWTAHRPRWILSSGFCGGLVGELARGDVVLADRIVDRCGAAALDVDLSPLDRALWADRPRVRRGTIVSVDSVVRRPTEKVELAAQSGAIAVDLESAAVAAACRTLGAPFLAVRAVSDAVDDALPREIENLSRQKSRAGQFGAALGAFLNRPGSVKDMYKLRENALLASDRLAKYLVELIVALTPAASSEALAPPASVTPEPVTPDERDRPAAD